MALHIFGCSRMQEKLRWKGRNPSWLSRFLPFFPKDLLSETRISDRTLVVRARMARSHFLILCLACFPLHCSIWSPKGSRALFPLPESISTSSQPHAERNRTLLMEGFLHAAWESLWFLLDSRCCSELLLTSHTMSRTVPTQGLRALFSP